MPLSSLPLDTLIFIAWHLYQSIPARSSVREIMTNHCRRCYDASGAPLALGAIFANIKFDDLLTPSSRSTSPSKEIPRGKDHPGLCRLKVIYQVQLPHSGNYELSTRRAGAIAPDRRAFAIVLCSETAGWRVVAQPRHRQVEGMEGRVSRGSCSPSPLGEDSRCDDGPCCPQGCPLLFAPAKEISITDMDKEIFLDMGHWNRRACGMRGLPAGVGLPQLRV